MALDGLSTDSSLNRLPEHALRVGGRVDRGVWLAAEVGGDSRTLPGLHRNTRIAGAGS